MTKPIDRDPIYRWRAFDANIIELCCRWYITYRLSYRDLTAIIAERGVAVSRTTVMRWTIRYVPEFEKRWNRLAKGVNSSWRVTVTPNDRSRECSPFKPFSYARIDLCGIELANRIRKRVLLHLGILDSDFRSKGAAKFCAVSRGPVNSRTSIGADRACRLMCVRHPTVNPQMQQNPSPDSGRRLTGNSLPTGPHRPTCGARLCILADAIMIFGFALAGFRHVHGSNLRPLVPLACRGR